METDADRAYKVLDRLTETAHQAMLKSTTLKEKLRFEKLRKAMQEAHKIVRLHHFENEDAAKIAQVQD